MNDPKNQETLEKYLKRKGFVLIEKKHLKKESNKKKGSNNIGSFHYVINANLMKYSQIYKEYEGQSIYYLGIINPNGQVSVHKFKKMHYNKRKKAITFLLLKTNHKNLKIGLREFHLNELISVRKEG